MLACNLIGLLQLGLVQIAEHMKICLIVKWFRCYTPYNPATQCMMGAFRYFLQGLKSRQWGEGGGGMVIQLSALILDDWRCDQHW